MRSRPLFSFCIPALAAAALLAACSGGGSADSATSPMAQAFLASRNYLLDGSKSSCDWDVDAGSGRALYPPSAMPQLVRSDYVANSNESGWLANPADLSATFSPVIGPMAKEQSLRTRLAFRQIADRLAGSDGLAGNKFDIDKLETLFFNARAHAADDLGTGARNAGQRAGRDRRAHAHTPGPVPL